MPPKLYTTFHDVNVKHYFTNGNAPKIINRTLSNYALVDWPNGKPCFLVNEWLHNIAKNSTGNTVETYAAQISFIIRYCHYNNLDFLELTDDNFYDVTEILSAETKENFQKKRNNNTTRNIIQRTFAFLFWVQTNTITSRTPSFTLIGEPQSNPSITVKVKINTRTGRSYFEHDCMPPDSVPESEKLPISDSTISLIENQIGFNARSMDPEQGSAVNYLYERRTFSVWMFKRFGLRPSELIKCSPTLNSNILKTKKIYLPTMKRRKSEPVMRTLTVSTSDALRFSRYLTSRSEFIESQQQTAPSYSSGGLLLTLSLNTLKTSSLTKEFYRLKTSAGLSEYRVCMSMFRHRFVTREVITALKEFMSSTGATRDMMTESAIYAILKRIATKTGHASPVSLWPYVAIAWASMDIWDSIDKSIEALQAADAILQDLNELQHQLKTVRFENLDEAVVLVRDIINNFIQRGLIHCRE